MERSQLDQVMTRMVAKIAHRGPDDSGTWARDGAGVSLGQTRLAILDLSPAGHQPMRDESTGNCITFNGEVYNYRELRRSLDDGSYDWKSCSDTEVILRAYAIWGDEFLKRLGGMFAFAIWDAQRSRLLLARDRLGIKPLYYYRGDGFLVFASEVRALLASGLVPREIDPVALWEFLAYQAIPAPRTMIKGVRSLLPGAWLAVEADGRVNEGRYWNLLENRSDDGRFATEAESRRRVGELLREAVSSHLVSDVPVAAFLSGGIDSSAVAALMREAGQKPQTFSVVFAERAYTEAQHARQVADLLGTEHTEILLTEHELLDQLPSALGAMDQPTGDGVNTYVVSRAVREAGVKVALSGLGGDEFFAGYPSFARLSRATPYFRAWGRTPPTVRSLAARTYKTFAGSSVAAAKTAALIETDGSLAATFPPLRQVLSVAQRRALLTEPWLRLAETIRDPYVELLRGELAREPQAGVLTQVSYAEARTYMHDVLLRDTDQMSMAHALEVRVPLLDHNLVEYVMGLPDAHKRPDGTPKRLLVESLGGLLPEEVVRRPKQGFTLPFEPWMRGSMRGFCEERLSGERIGARGIMRPEQVRTLWRDFVDGRPSVSWSRLWILVVLEEWLEQNGVSCGI